MEAGEAVRRAGAARHLGYPVVITTGSVFVTAGTDRRSSGTHYTPKSLTEPIVQYTLEPLVYVGPAEGMPKDSGSSARPRNCSTSRFATWPAGPGLSWSRRAGTWPHGCSKPGNADAASGTTPEKHRSRGITPEGEPSTGQPGEMLIPDRSRRAADLRPADRGPAVLVRRGQEPAGGGNGEAVALAADARQGQAVRVPGPCHPLRRFAGRHSQPGPTAEVQPRRQGERQQAVPCPFLNQDQ